MNIQWIIEWLKDLTESLKDLTESLKDLTEWLKDLAEWLNWKRIFFIIYIYKKKKSEFLKPVSDKTAA